MDNSQLADDLSEDARIAYRAFQDMQHSSAAHLACMQTLESKYRDGGTPSRAEKNELEQLLAVHDRNVTAFQAALAAVSDSQEMQALVTLMS